MSDDLRAAVCEVLGQFTDIGIGPERTEFRELLVERLAARDVEQRRQGAAEALGRFADTRGVNIGDEDDAWWRGYRQAQRECLRDAVDAADRLAAPVEALGGEA